MSNVKSTEIDGELSVGRNVALGGRLTVGGSGSVHHNLRVEGWLDAENIKGQNKGVFADIASLKAAYPESSQSEGTFAIVGGTLPGELWYIKNGVWTDSGKTAGEITADVEQYLEDIEQLSGDVDTLSNEVKTFEEGLTTETSERKAADATLQGNIDTEATERKAADTELDGKITAETTARSSADTTLQANIDSEATTRSEADAELQQNIDTEASERKAADTALQQSLDSEKEARQSGDTVLQSNIDAEAAARESADTTLQDNINTEATARSEADTTLQSNIDAEATARESADTTLRSVIDAIGGTGYRYMGVATLATDPGTPTENVMYLALTEGDYENFGTGQKYLDGDGTAHETVLSLADGEVALLLRPGYVGANGLVNALGWMKQKIDLAEAVEVAAKATLSGAEGGYAPIGSDGKVALDWLTQQIVWIDYWSDSGMVARVAEEGKLWYNAGEGKLYEGATITSLTGAVGVGWKQKTVESDVVYVSKATNRAYRLSDGILTEIGPKGTEQMVDMDNLVPLVTGYYTLQTALSALKTYQESLGVDYRKRGMVISYATSANFVESMQYQGTTVDNAFWQPGNWQAYGTDNALAAAEAARVAAEAEREAWYESAKTAVEGADNLDVSLTDGVLSVTNRQGETSEVNIGDAYESFEVVATTAVSGVTVAGTVVSVYLNNSSTALTYTLDSDGKASFTIARGTYYSIELPDKAGCKAITPITGTATGGSKTVSVEYEAYADDEVETVTVNVRKRVDGAYSAWSGQTVHVAIGSDTTDYTTDSNGQVTFEVGYGQSYTVSMDEDTTGGYYVHNGTLSYTYTARVTARTVWMTWYEYRTGVFVVCDDGVEYTADEWTAAGKTADETPAIKVVTERLQEGGGAVYIDASRLNTAIGSTSEYPSKQWATGTMQTTSIDGIANSLTSATYYDGAAATELIIAACEDQGCEAPAASYCKEQTLAIGSSTLTGYLPACGQWTEVWANRSAVDTWLTTLFGDDAKQLSNFTTNKWTSMQASANNAMMFGSSPDYNIGKGYSFRAVAFYAY